MRQLIEDGWLKRNGLTCLLWPLSLMYQAVMWLRLKAYEIGWINSKKLPIPVIVVGNVSVGGTGKTPLVIHLVQQLQQRGYVPGVISRGYKGEAGQDILLMDESIDVRQSGDEARLIFEQTNAPVAIAANRVEAAQMLIEQRLCNVIISDDGFAHFRLKRDFDIVVVDGMRGFGNGWCLPAGFLREPLSALSRADAIVINGELIEKWRGQLSQYETYSMKLDLAFAYRLSDGKQCNLSDFSHKKAHAVAGIGNPARFFTALYAFTIQLTEHIFADHHDYCLDDLQFNDDMPILMTQKDAVKCQDLPYDLKQRIWVASVRTIVNPELVETIITTIEARL